MLSQLTLEDTYEYIRSHIKTITNKIKVQGIILLNMSPYTTSMHTYTSQTVIVF